MVICVWTTGNVVTNILEARNTLTQRTYGPACSGRCGFGGFRHEKWRCSRSCCIPKALWIRRSQDGRRNQIFGYGEDGSDDNPNGNEIERVELDPSVERVYLRADMDFKQKTDKAVFFYSLDGKEWSQIGDTLQMAYTLPHFMGYRFGLFNYATIEAGGYAGF